MRKSNNTCKIKTTWVVCRGNRIITLYTRFNNTTSEIANHNSKGGKSLPYISHFTEQHTVNDISLGPIEQIHKQTALTFYAEKACGLPSYIHVGLLASMPWINFPCPWFSAFFPRNGNQQDVNHPLLTVFIINTSSLAQRYTYVHV